MINSDELLFVVDENNNSIEPKSRTEVHSKGYWHRTTHIWVVNSNGQILCQKRSLLKDTAPGKWEPIFGGHMAPDSDYLENAVNELNEELGLSVAKDQLEQFRVHKSDKDKEYQAVFIFKCDFDANMMKLEKEEVDQIKWVDKNIVLKKFKNKDKNWNHHQYTEALIKNI